MHNQAIRSFRHALALGVAAFALAGAGALAQTAPAGDAATTDEADAPDIIVTGTSRPRVALDTPLAVTQLNNESLVRLQASGQADVLNSIPTIKADGGGGEVAANVFVRGLPSGGQYQFTPLMYDGIPVMSTFGLNSSAFDVYYRNDLGIERLEFVRGGVSNLFGPGSVAGLINYISTTGDETLRGTAQLEVAEKGRYRGDLALSGPLSENLFFAVSGFYRHDDGPVDTNLPTKGGQLRGNLKYVFPDDSGSVTLYGQLIDDKAVFYLPVPLDGATRNRAPGNDGNAVYQVLNNWGDTLGFNMPGGQRFTSKINDGVLTRGGQIALAFDKSMGESFGINGKVKYSRYRHQFGLWSDGDGLVNVPETLASFVTSTARRNGGYSELNGITAANATYTFVGGGAVPASTLLFANRFTDRNRPMQDFSGELNLTGSFGDAVSHTVTLGAFYASTVARDINVTTTYLAEFNNTPRLVNLTVTNPTTGVTTTISRNGLLNAGAGYVNNRHKVDRYAVYLADQIDAGPLKFDLGVRLEQFKGEISRERTATFVTDTAAGLSGVLRDVISGNGLYTTGKVSTSEWAAAAGALYKINDETSIYLNASRGYFFPEIRSAGFNSLFQVQSFEPEIIKQVQGGIKLSRSGFSLEAAGFYTDLTNRRQVLFVNDGQGGFTERVNLVGTRSYGLEGVVDIKLMRNLRFSGNITLQNATYRTFTQLVNNVPVPNPAVVGKKLERQPNILYNAGLYYDDGTIDVSAYTNYTGDNFTANTNAIELKGWNIANFDAGYKFGIGNNRSIRVGVNVFNVFDTDAVTEGSPRQDTNQTVGGAYFVGRPVLPRRITARVAFNF